MENSKREALFKTGIGVFCLLLMYITARNFMPFISDDAFISFRYSERFAHGEGLTWNPGERVEGYSNLLWVLLMALPAKAGFDLPFAAQVIGWLFCAAVPLILLSGKNNEGGWHGLAPAIFFSTSGVTAAWAIGGLEQALLAFLMAVSIRRFWNASRETDIRFWHAIRLGLFPALICITRPDGVIFAAVFCVWFAAVWFQKAGVSGWMKCFLPALLPLVFFGAQLLFRISYYGEWVPNTALVKISPTLSHFRIGLGYVRRFFTGTFPMGIAVFALSFIGLFRKKDRMDFLLPFSLAAVWIAYLVFIGGDIFPAFRHGLVLMVIFAFAFSRISFSGYFLPSEMQGRRISFLIGGLLAISFAGYVYLQHTWLDFVNAKNENWEELAADNGRFLHDYFSKEQPLIAVTAAGATPYYAKFPCIDMLGLNDRHIAKHPPKDAGKGLIGHEFGDGAYVLERNPDIVIFHTGNELDEGRSAKEMLNSSDFHLRYAPVRVQTASQLAVWWISRVNPKVGIFMSDDSIRIPAWHFATDSKGPVLEGNGKGKSVIRLKPGEHASCILPYPAAWNGEWVCKDYSECGIIVKERTRAWIRNTTDRMITLDALVLKSIPDRASVKH